MSHVRGIALLIWCLPVVSLSSLSLTASAEPATASPPEASVATETSTPLAVDPPSDALFPGSPDLSQLDPHHPDAHLTAGVERYARGDYAGATAEFQQVLALVPDHPYARHYLALAQRKQRATDILGSPSQETAGAAEAHRQEGTVCLATGDTACAVAALREAIRLDPAQPRAQDALGLALAQQGDLDGAIEAYRAAIRLQPSLAPPHIHLAAVLMVKQQWGAALRELDEAISLEPESTQAHALLGSVRYATGDRPGAIAAYRRAATLKPDYPDAHYHLGLLLKLGGQEREAATEFLVAAQAGMPMAQYFLGTAYAAGAGVERDLAEAIRWYFRAADQGHTQAGDALSKLRRTALSSEARDSAQARATTQAFEAYRAQIRREFAESVTDGTAIEGNDEPVGALLLRLGRTDQAVTVLIREASALSEPAQSLLEVWYQQREDSRLKTYDARILSYFKAAAAEGLPRQRRALARIYAHGLGVERDAGKAVALLKDDQDGAAQRLLREITAAQRDGSTTTPTQPRMNDTH